MTDRSNPIHQREDILASLVAQANSEGAQLDTLRAMLEETTELAADRALARLGLGDEGAEGDLGELRELLAAWRDAKSSAWKAMVGWVVRATLALLLVGIAVRLGVWDML